MISDGSAVLGLGDIGPAASLPVMEGKSALFKTFGGLDSIPIVLATKDPDEIVETIIRLRPTFGAVNLEDISAPRCFEIERRVIEALDCPVMHDDQHGTAIVVLGALLGATKVLDRDMHTLRIVISGAGAAGVACANILLAAGITDITRAGQQGHPAHRSRRPEPVQGRAGRDDQPARPHRRHRRGDSTAPTCSWASRPALVPEELIATMAPGGIVFAMSNPDPEIHPDAARKYAAVVATGRSDFPNQINNVLAFPGVFRGALDAGARRITEAMKVAAAEAIFSVVGDDLAIDHIVPSALDPRVGPGGRGGSGGGVEGLSPRHALRRLAVLARRSAGRRLRRSAAAGAVRRRRCGPRTPSRRCWPTCTRRRCGSTAALRMSSSAPDPLADLDTGDVEVVPGLTGRLLVRFDPDATARAAEQVYRSMISALPEGIGAGDYAQSAEDKPAPGGHRRDRAEVGCDATSRRWSRTARSRRSARSSATARPAARGDVPTARRHANSRMPQRCWRLCGRVASMPPGRRRPRRRPPTTSSCSATGPSADPRGERRAALPAQRVERDAGAGAQRDRR